MSSSRSFLVLVVEPDAVLRDVLVQVLESDGLRVLSSATSEHGLLLASLVRPDLVVVDEHPTVDGVVFAAGLAALPRPQPVTLWLTYRRDPTSLVGLLDADAVMEKPFDVDALLAAAWRLLQPAACACA